MESEGRRASDAILPQFMEEIGAMRQALLSLNETLRETKATVAAVGEKAIRTEREFHSFREGIRLAAAVTAVFLAIAAGGAGYYFHQRDTRIEQIAIEIKSLSDLAIANLKENRRQADADQELMRALTTALEAIKTDRDGRRK